MAPLTELLATLTAGLCGTPSACTVWICPSAICHLGWNVMGSGTPTARRRRRSRAQVSGR